MSLHLINDLYEVSSDKMVLHHRSKTGVQGRLISAPTTILARRTDAETSHVAAEKACEFKARHIARIWTCLKDNGAMIPAEIAKATGLGYHAAQRRMSEMRDKGLIERTGVVRYGQHELRAKG